MKIARMILSSGLALVIGAALGLSPALTAQEKQEKEESARKVKNEVRPSYPTLARQMNITGTVRIEAVIAPDGKIKSTKVLGGHPVLVDAAQDALKQWKFEAGPRETIQIVQFKFVRPE